MWGGKQSYLVTQMWSRKNGQVQHGPGLEFCAYETGPEFFAYEMNHA